MEEVELRHVSKMFSSCPSKTDSEMYFTLWNLPKVTTKL